MIRKMLKPDVDQFSECSDDDNTNDDDNTDDEGIRFEDSCHTLILTMNRRISTHIIAFASLHLIPHNA